MESDFTNNDAPAEFNRWSCCDNLSFDEWKKMTNVVRLRPRDATDPDQVLEQAVGKYNHVVVVGVDSDGNFDARCSLGVSVEQAVWLLEKTKSMILTMDQWEIV